MKYQKINALKLAFSAGIVSAIVLFLTTITAIYGKSNFAGIFTKSIWSSFGYSISWPGAFMGAILGFIYAFVIVKITFYIYNKLISK